MKRDKTYIFPVLQCLQYKIYFFFFFLYFETTHNAIYVYNDTDKAKATYITNLYGYILYWRRCVYLCVFNMISCYFLFYFTYICFFIYSICFKTIFLCEYGIIYYYTLYNSTAFAWCANKYKETLLFFLFNCLISSEISPLYENIFFDVVLLFCSYFTFFLGYSAISCQETRFFVCSNRKILPFSSNY